MPSYYSVVQYAPDPIIDERINFGVLVYGDGSVRGHFLKHWTRLRQFAGKSVSFLQEFAERAGDLTEDDIRKMSLEWMHGIRVTEPRGSLLDPDALVKDVAKRFLIEIAETKPVRRHRRDAANLAKRSLSAAMRAQVQGEAKKYMKQDFKVEGEKMPHYLDVGLKNEKLRVGVRGLSFELPEGPELTKEVSSTGYAIEDLKRVLPHIDFSVVAIPPKRKINDTYKRAVDAFREMGATVVDEVDVDSWAKKCAVSFLQEHAPNRPNRALHASHKK